VDVRTIRRDIRRLREVGYEVNTRGYYRDIGKGSGIVQKFPIGSF